MPQETIIVVGSGGREHALAWACERDPKYRVLCTRGNAGITFENRRDVKETDFLGLIDLAKAEAAKLVIFGPEIPLIKGGVDALREAGVAAFGPTAAAARLEASKLFTKDVCAIAKIPTANWASAPEYRIAESLIRRWKSVPVIKADGVCGGKGVVVAKTIDEALRAARDMFDKKPPYGDAGAHEICIEDRLEGVECSVMAICSGTDSLLLPVSRDNKPLLEGNEGPNTGGMGAKSPLDDVDDALLAEIKARIIDPALRFMADRGTPFQGLLYAGLMLTKDGPYLLEFNVRFGDPETQVVLPRIKSDIVPYLLATLEPGALAKLPPLEISPDIAVGINLVSQGYPDAAKYKTGYKIRNLDEVAKQKGVLLFHAGTERQGKYVMSSGGRVMTCVGMASTLGEARTRACRAARMISFENKFYRGDIGDDAPRF